MNIKPIKSESDYQTTLKRIEDLMHADFNSTEGDELDILVTLIQAYEAKCYPLDFLDPIDAIKFHMEHKGMVVKDLVPFIGNLNRVYEVLNHRRPLTLKMITRLHNELGIPAASLLPHSTSN